jgi:hypothetical protein
MQYHIQIIVKFPTIHFKDMASDEQHKNNILPSPAGDQNTKSKVID